MRIVSLFAGAGGLDLGLQQAGHEIVWANDVDSDCVKSYSKNLGGTIWEGDVRDVSPGDIPRADVVTAGLPCQGFSMANLRRSPNDERNAMYLEFLRVLRAARPRYFLAENVKGLLSLGGGRAFRRIVSDFSACGYDVEHRILNAADFGVPQHRERVFIVGTRKDLTVDAGFPWPAPTHSGNGGHSSELRPWVSIAEALRGIPEPDSQHDLLNHVNSKYHVVPRNFTGHRVTDPSKPCPTILARGGGEGGVVAIPHPKGHRRLTVRESATIQTFPLDYEFFGGLGSMYRQVGNAVPVLLSQKFGESFAAVEDRA
jgi:DNA (cytosine-5)-methyltransferase 1